MSGPVTYNPQVTDGMPVIPTLESVIRSAMRQAAQAMRVCMPGRVVATANRLHVDVQPLFKARYAVDSAPIELPIICGVPVSMPSGANWSVSGPVTVGDQGMLIFADRSMVPWQAGAGQAADPNDARCHSISDAIFVPGLLTDTQASARADASSDLILNNGAAQLRLQSPGTVAVGNGSVELVALVQQLADAVAALANAVATATVKIPGPSSVPPPPPVVYPVGSSATAAAANAVATLANQIKGSFS